MILLMLIIFTTVIASDCLHQPLYVRDYTPLKLTITGNQNKTTMGFELDDQVFIAILEPFRGSVPFSWTGHLEERSRRSNMFDFNIQMFTVRLNDRPQSDGYCFIDTGSVLCVININQNCFLIEPYHWYHTNHLGLYNAVGYWGFNLRRCSDSDSNTCEIHNSNILLKPSGWPFEEFEGPLIGEAARSKWRQHQPPPIKEQTGWKVAPKMSKLSFKIGNSFQNVYNSTQLPSTNKKVGYKLVINVTKSSSNAAKVFQNNNKTEKNDNTEKTKTSTERLSSIKKKSEMRFATEITESSSKKVNVFQHINKTRSFTNDSTKKPIQTKLSKLNKKSGLKSPYKITQSSSKATKNLDTTGTYIKLSNISTQQNKSKQTSFNVKSDSKTGPKPTETSPKVTKRLAKYIHKTRIQNSNSTNVATQQKKSEQPVSKTGPKKSETSPRVTVAINIMNDSEISYRKRVTISKEQLVNKQGLLSNEKNSDSETDPRMPKASANVTKPVKKKMNSNGAGILDRKLTKKKKNKAKAIEFDPLKNKIQSEYKCVKKMGGYYDPFCHEKKAKHDKWMDNTKWPCVPVEGYFHPLCTPED